MIDTKTIAQSKINHALAKIEKAQKLLSEACGELMPIQGMILEHELLGNAYDQTRQSWAQISGRRHFPDIDLDSSIRAKLAANED